VWGSALTRDGEFRRDALIMEMVDAKHAGVAFTEVEYEDDAVNFTFGTADRLVSGDVTGEAFFASKLDRFESPTETDFKGRLQILLRSIRQTFGEGNWDVEWADDGTQCWLIQVRPITKPLLRNEAFTSANHKEILPDPPSRFMASLITSCADDLFSYYRNFDPTLPQSRSFIETFRGRPFINLSLLTDMMRRWGLPTRLVTDSIGGDHGPHFGVNPLRLAAKSSVLLKMGAAQATAVAAARRRIQSIDALQIESCKTFGECVAMLQKIYVGLVQEMFSLTAAMSGPLALLRRAGVLAELSARHRTVTTDMHFDLEPLRQAARRDPCIRAELEAGRLPNDEEFRSLWEAYLARHGHRGIYESDIARPRYHERPEPLFAAIVSAGETPKTSPLSWRAILLFPIWRQASGALRAREELRYHTMRAFDRVRRRLLTLAECAVARGALATPEQLWLAEIAEAEALDHGWLPNEQFFTQRMAEQMRLQTYSFPDTFRRFDDLESFAKVANRMNFDARLHGLSLTRGCVRGRAWTLVEPQTKLPEGFVRSNTVLVARSVDAGWLPTFSKVAGVVVEIGGDLSHGSILLRELGVPAITNVRNATRAIATGDEVVLYADEGAVEVPANAAR
jgi:pyruvate,water dikinase